MSVSVADTETGNVPIDDDLSRQPQRGGNSKEASLSEMNVGTELAKG